ncbi:Rim4 [Kluyveromyces lactis]|nr:Rim4 [Kluyveromyces lactis]
MSSNMSKNIDGSFKDRIVINDSPNDSVEVLRQRSNEGENQPKNKEDITSNKSVINLEKELTALKIDRQSLLDDNLTKLLPEQLSEIASESETDSDEDTTNLLDEPSPRSSDDPSFSRPSSCIFVASLAATLSDSELNASVTKEFAKYGKIVSVKVLRDPANRPYAFVQYASDDEALNALSQAQGTTLNNRNIRCERAKVNRTVFISSSFANPLEGKLTVEKVVDLMSKFGELEQVVPSRDQMYKKNYYPSEVANSWFIQYAYRDDAIRAYLQMKLNYEYMVEWAQNVDVPPRFNLLLSKAKICEKERLERERFGKQPIFIDNKSIFIGQLNFKVTKSLLLERFLKYGEIDNCNLIHKQEQLKCFAFIKYKTPASAAKALERENHSIFMEKILHVQIREVSNSRRSSIDSNKSFQGPQLNLAPPPLNIGRRASTGSFSKYLYPLPNHLQPNLPSHYVYATIQEPRRNTINSGSSSYHNHNHVFVGNTGSQGFFNENGNQYGYGTESKNYPNKIDNGVEKENAYLEGPQQMHSTHFNRSKDDIENSTIEEEDDEYEVDEDNDAEDTHFLEHESNSSFTTFSAGTGTFKHNNAHNTGSYQKNHSYKKRRNVDAPRHGRLDPNFYYGPPVYYPMEYCPPSGSPVGPPPSHLIQPGAHLTGQCPPSQHSPFFYYFPMPPPTPTFTNPFPHEHPGGVNYLDNSVSGHDKADLDY